MRGGGGDARGDAHRDGPLPGRTHNITGLGRHSQTPLLIDFLRLLCTCKSRTRLASSRPLPPPLPAGARWELRSEAQPSPLLPWAGLRPDVGAEPLMTGEPPDPARFAHHLFRRAEREGRHCRQPSPLSPPLSGAIHAQTDAFDPGEPTLPFSQTRGLQRTIRGQAPGFHFCAPRLI